MPKVSAIVSVYKTDQDLLDMRIGNLLGQSLTDIEVMLVINRSSHDRNGNPSYGGMLVEWSDDPRLKIIHTKREGIYASWNRAIRAATGQYITNANTDDLLLSNGLKTLSDALDTHLDVGLVYGDSFVVKTAPAPFQGPEEFDLCHEQPYPNGVLGLREYSQDDLMAGHSIGNCPMWRRGLHEQFGYFDESMQLAADYEWALRLQSEGVSFYYVGDSVGTFYFGKNSTTLHQSQSNYEATLARLRWVRGNNGSARSGHARNGEASAGN